MIVDDNSATRRMVRNALARHGHEVIEAADGKTARELMRTECPCLVLQDLVLPDADGFRLVGELRSLAPSRVSILAFSGFVSQVDEDQVSIVGFDDVIAKPIAPSRLVPLIEAHLSSEATSSSRAASDAPALRPQRGLGSVHPFGHEIGQVLTLAKIYKDLEAAEVNVARQAALIEAIVENAPDCVMHLDCDGIIQFVNRAEPPETTDGLVGQSWFDRVMIEQRPLARLTFETVLATGVAKELELKFAREAGRSAWFQLRIGAVGRGAAAMGCVIVARDITDKKQAELQLMLADRMASIGALAGGVAQEISNPLAAVIANLDFAEQDLTELVTRHSVPPDLVEAVRDARVSADRVREIVRDLKVFSRAQEDLRGAVDVEKVLNSALRMAWSELRHRAKVEKAYKRVPRVDANEGRLGQVFVNILVNAIQAIPDSDYENNLIRIATEVEGDHVVISISDTGIGMPIEVERRLFTPFFTTKPAGVGTGLGLAISHRIISDYGGTIECSTALHRGTTFRVRLPIAPANLPPVTRRVPLTTPPKRRGRVLIIDDEDSLVQAIRRYVTHEHDVDGVTSARAGIDLLTRGAAYDVIVCDLMLPQITGMEFYAVVQKLDPALAGRIVFITGGAFTESARSFLERMPNQRIEKPFDLKTLRNVINGLVQ